MIEDRARIIQAMLAHVPFEGWSASALAATGRDLGLPEGAAELAFPGGISDVLTVHLEEADRQMLAGLAQHDLSVLKVRQKVALAIRLRLEQAAPHKEAVRRALALLATPRHAPLAPRALYRTVDAIWRACGDRATDFNFYTKRGLLAAVYMATLLHWLDDRSEGHAATWAFLDRRIGEVMKIPQATGRLRGAIDRLPSPLRLWQRLRRA
ncbi:MAG: COQ9 family protein [Thalassobaculales bacterium]